MLSYTTPVTLTWVVSLAEGVLCCAMSADVTGAHKDTTQATTATVVILDTIRSRLAR